MKKTIRIVLFSLVFCLLLSGTSFADGTQGLSNFTSSREYGTQLFSDISPNGWYYTGVKTTYEKSIMDGVGGGRFAPNETVTLAQAITIASRVHAIYYGKTILDVNSKNWYDKYFEYAKINQFMSKSIANSDINATNATRADIAYLFNQVINKIDLGVINDMSIPDFDSIAPDCKEAVKNMYGAGIIAGKDRAGNFVGDGLATRAEIATIIARLIDKTERVAYDTNDNASLYGQEGNYFTGNILVYDTDFSYHIRVNSSQKYQIVKKNRTSGSLDLVYESEDILTKLTLCNHELYYLESLYNDDYPTKRELKKINLDTGVTALIYSDIYMDFYTVYNNSVYVETCKMFDKMTYSFTIGKVMDKEYLYSLYTGIGTVDNISIYNNTLYFNHGSDIFKIDLKTKESKKILSNVETYTIAKNILYYSDNSGNIYKCTLPDTRNIKLITTAIPSELSEIRALNYSGGNLYISFISKKGIYTVNNSGVVELYCKLQKTPAMFAVINNRIVYNSFYTSNPKNLIIGGKSISEQQNQYLTDWLDNTGNNISENNNRNVRTLNSKEIFEKCSPAVFRLIAYDLNKKPIVLGSGFFISADGIAVTNYHVIKDAYYIGIEFSDGKFHAAAGLVGYNPEKDIAILKIIGNDFDYLSIADSSALSSGEKVYTIGSPLGLTNTISEGILSNPDRLIENSHWLQISVPISPGSSGGALINEYGEVIGITTASITIGQEINFAVPINQVFTIQYKLK